MSINFSTIKTALVTWITANTGLTYAILADQNSPQPLSSSDLKTSSYAVLRIQTTAQIGEDYISPPDSVSGNANISGNREITVFIEIKGYNAVSLMCQLRDSLQKPSVQATLRLSKLYYVDNFPVQDITGLDDTQYVERASMDVLFRAYTNIVDNVGVIETAEVSGIIEDQAGNTVYEETITIPEGA